MNKKIVALVVLLVVLVGLAAAYFLGGEDLMGRMRRVGPKTTVTPVVDTFTRAEMAGMIVDEFFGYNNMDEYPCEEEAYSVEGGTSLCFLVDLGIMNTYADGSLGYENGILRAEAAKVLYEVVEHLNIEPPVVADGEYTDVSEEAWYYTFVDALGSWGIPSVKFGGKFYHSDPLTESRFEYWLDNLTDFLESSVNRQELAKYLVVNAGWELADPSGPHFADVPETSDYYLYVETAYAYGFINGYPNGEFGPLNEIIRAEAAKSFVEAYEFPLVENPGDTFVDVPLGVWYGDFVETLVAEEVILEAAGSFSPGEYLTHGTIIEWVTIASNN